MKKALKAVPRAKRHAGAAAPRRPAPPPLPPGPLDPSGPPGPPVVVGIGASAGGLEALQQLVEALPVDTGMAFVHVQHLDPQHKSMMADLLQGSTRMKVAEATDDALIERNCIYISPSDRDVTVVGGKLRLVKPGEPQHGRLAIDSFFRSLAQAMGERAIAVVLSGTGTDGSLGIRAVKSAGGMAVVQDPKSAKYDGMPRSAIATQLVDFVVPPHDIPRVLVDYVRHAHLIAPDAIAPTPAGQLGQIFLLLREQTGHDFARYKQSTLRRRIERRMAVHQIERLDDYVRYLHRFPAEVDALFKDLLIGVTNFFRDQEAFRAIEEKVVPALCDASAGTGQIRAWVPGCSTGEEAYSLALLIAEHLDRVRLARKATVFATDIDPAAIDVARAAVYPEAAGGDVPDEGVSRLFTRDNGSLRIAKRIREMVIFAVQDVLKDPPFSKIDLISCRNLLIYLEPDLQRRLMQLFHAVLNPGGFLLLGASETVGDAADLFTTVDKKWKIYEKKPVPTHPRIGVTSLHSLNEGSAAVQRGVEAGSELPSPGIGELTARVLLESYAPACVVVDEHYDIVYLQGRTARYLDLPVGAPQLNLLKMARDELLRELRTALHRAVKERGEVVRDRIAVGDDRASRFVRIRVKPFRGPRPAQQLFLVAFEDLPHVDTGEAQAGQPADPHVTELERRLASMKESLQSTVEEVETSNEELRSTNEEMQSANEELQSTNEELETSKEELQSVNEELMTVNNELQKKLEELGQANNDLANLLNSTEIGTIFLDNELRIKRFTPAVSRLVNLIPTDVGRPVGDIVTQLNDDDLPAQAHDVLRSLVFHEREVRTRDGRWYLRRILPYRTVENMIDGVVVTFVDITEVREAQRMVEAMLTFANAVLDAVRHPVVLLSKEGRIVKVNQAFYPLFGAHREDTLGASVHDLDGPWANAELRAKLDVVLDGGPPMVGLAVTAELPKLGKRGLRFYATRIAFGTKAFAGEDELTLLAIEDVTHELDPHPHAADPNGGSRPRAGGQDGG